MYILYLPLALFTQEELFPKIILALVRYNMWCVRSKENEGEIVREDRKERDRERKKRKTKQNTTNNSRP